MPRFLDRAVMGALLVVASAGAAAAADTAAGEKVFNLCKACHMVGPQAKNRVGPVLNGVVGRPAATVEGYKYSAAMTGKAGEGLVWDEPTLSAYLADPKAVVKGTKMAFAGLKKDEDIANVIAYLAQFAADGSKAAANVPATDGDRPPTDLAAAR